MSDFNNQDIFCTSQQKYQIKLRMSEQFVSMDYLTIIDYRIAYKLVFEYIETFYNTVRIYGHCGYLSPDELEGSLETTKKSIKCVQNLDIVPNGNL